MITINGSLEHTTAYTYIISNILNTAHKIAIIIVGKTVATQDCVLKPMKINQMQEQNTHMNVITFYFALGCYKTNKILCASSFLYLPPVVIV